MDAFAECFFRYCGPLSGQAELSPNGNMPLLQELRNCRSFRSFPYHLLGW